MVLASARHTGPETTARPTEDHVTSGAISALDQAVKNAYLALHMPITTRVAHAYASTNGAGRTALRTMVSAIHTVPITSAQDQRRLTAEPASPTPIVTP